MYMIHVHVEYNNKVLFGVYDLGNLSRLLVLVVYSNTCGNNRHREAIVGTTCWFASSIHKTFYQFSQYEGAATKHFAVGRGGMVDC